MSNQVQSDVHSLSVVSNRTYTKTTTGRISEKESWIKVTIEGGEGSSVSDKFRLLAASPLQFKVSTAARVQDAKATDTYYPRGAECAQLFSVLGNIRFTTLDMVGFDARKWQKRFSPDMLANERLGDYADMVERAAQAELDQKVQATIVSPAEFVGPMPENRMTDAQIPTVQVQVEADAATVPVSRKKSRKGDLSGS